MKKYFLYAFLLILLLVFFCCSSESPEKYEILARINDYSLTLDEFKSQLAAELEFDKDFKLTKEARQEFLEEIIKRELLIQEAKRLKLDRGESFLRTIERYWESTLIRNLMELKGKKIAGKTYISQEELEEHYKKMKQSRGKLPPLKDIESKITDKLKESKKSRMLGEWINNLRKRARIEINQELFQKN